jgi:hypothetical protein
LFHSLCSKYCWNRYINNEFLCGAAAQIRPKPPRFDFSRSHTITHTHTHTRKHSSERLISKSQRLLPTQHTQTQGTNPSVGFEPATPAINWPQTYALDRMAPGIGKSRVTCLQLQRNCAQLRLPFVLQCRWLLHYFNQSLVGW